MGPKSGRKNDVSDLLMAEFERANLNWHTKGALAECNIIEHAATVHRFVVSSQLKGCNVPTLEISDATRIKAGQLLDVSFTSCCSRLILLKIPGGCLLSIAWWRLESRHGQFQPARSSTFSARSP